MLPNKLSQNGKWHTALIIIQAHYSIYWVEATALLNKIVCWFLKNGHEKHSCACCTLKTEHFSPSIKCSIPYLRGSIIPHATAVAMVSVHVLLNSKWTQSPKWLPYGPNISVLPFFFPFVRNMDFSLAAEKHGLLFFNSTFSFHFVMAFYTHFRELWMSAMSSLKC